MVTGKFFYCLLALFLFCFCVLADAGFAKADAIPELRERECRAFGAAGTEVNWLGFVSLSIRVLYLVL